MIKANELRIGNFFIGIGGVQTVLSLEENTNRGKCNYSSEEHRLMYSHLILCHQNGNQYKPFEIEPIPLTEGILLKVGFLKDNNYSGLHSKIGALEIKIRFNSKIAYCEIGGIYFGDRFKYLHELQNIWYSISGQELNTAGLI